MLRRWVIGFSLVLWLLTASAQDQPPSCCEPEAETLSQQQVEALVEKMEPILAPCCADRLHIDGTIVLAISVGTDGNVSCVKVISGHPLMFGATIESVKHWKFRPYTSQRVKKSFCGQLALHLHANEYRVKYKMVLAAPANSQTIALLSSTGLGQAPPNKSKKFFQSTQPDGNTTVRFFYDPPGGDYFHVPLVFRAVKDGDSRLNSAPILEEGRTAFISFREMTELLEGLGNNDLQWQESETVQALGPYKKIPFSDAGYGSMVISIAHSSGTARAILTPKKICQTLKPLDSALKTPRALWEFQGFRINYGCKVPGFKYGEYEDHY